MFENKYKFALWVLPETLASVEELYREDNCRSKSEFIEKAIRFYCGYLTSKDKGDYLPRVVTSTLKSIVAESDNRQSHTLFKLAVELAMLQNIIAYTHSIDRSSLEQLRNTCIRELKQTNGTLSLEDALDWQGK